MKVFISWSGPTSRQVAKNIYDWLPIVLQHIEPYMSTENIDTGTRWFASVGSELETSNFGLFCLTRDNLNSPWLHWEAGAISKVVDHSKVVPMLFRLQPSDISGPLTQFQAATFEKDQMFRVLKSINNAAAEEALDETRLLKIFTSMWGQLDAGITDISEEMQEDAQGSSSASSNNSKILEELLVLARQQSISSSDTFKYFADKLQEQTYDLQSALNLAFPESAESRRALNHLSHSWEKFGDTWNKFTTSRNTVSTGILNHEEFTALTVAIIELYTPIAILLDQSRQRPTREALATTFRHFRHMEPTKAQQAALGGAFEPPYPPPEPANETPTKG